MLLDELKTPFRWYEDESMLLKNRACNGYRYKLITPFDRLLPFMFRFLSGYGPDFPVSWKVYSSETGLQVADLAPYAASDLLYYQLLDKDYLVFTNGSALFDLDLSAGGFFYSIITLDSGREFVSEDFWVDCETDGNTIVNGSLKKYTKLQWWNDCDLDNLLYQTGYHNILYFEGDLVRDEPLLTEEGDEDGKKDFIATSRKYIDTIKFDDFVPEYILTALLAVRIHKFVTVTTKQDQYTGTALNFQVAFAWSNDCYAKVDVKFNQETTLLMTNCCSDNAITDYYACPVVIATENMVVGGTSGRFVFIDWTAVGVPFEYLITGFPGLAVQRTVNTFFSMDDIPDGDYIIQVRPECAAANGHLSYGNTIEFRFSLPFSCVNASEFQIDLDTITQTSATAVWADSPNTPVTYELSIERNDTPGVPLTGYPVSTPSGFYPFTGLLPGTSYRAYIRTDCGSSQSGWSDTLFTTLP